MVTAIGQRVAKASSASGGRWAVNLGNRPKRAKCGQLCFRLTKDATRMLIAQLVAFMPQISRKTAISHELQILASLNFFASGSYQRRTGQDFFTCMSQTSLSRSLHATVNALNCIIDDWICFPVTADRIQSIKQRFFRNGGFPGVIGAIDGTHVAIFPPEIEREYLFINRKLYHSLNVLVICDSKCEILAVNSAHGGRTHDARVLRSSRVFAHLEQRHREGEINSWLIGDSAYPLLPFLLTPQLNQVEGTPGARYTDHHVRTRVTIERCFGILKGRWRCLRKERALHYSPQFAALVVNACCILHNMAIKWRIPNDEIYLDEMDIEPPIPCNIAEETGEQTQTRVIQWYFTN
ncbi:putative nuclease HARBI1 [Nylanderia fulva]|uniref:putative nuclease HARBI1 n=1 Tax=Nylanderia fulva TaxID=613905 RepID=UPI0010FB6DF4|nr:putative nuclease HARBI1 [Nylanderia fulva]XP_029176459.1 putative nuclease HARBI1 [Nylanderia fulva]